MCYLMSLSSYFKLAVLGLGFNSSTQDEKFKSSPRRIMMDSFEGCLCYMNQVSKGGGAEAGLCEGSSPNGPKPKGSV